MDGLEITNYQYSTDNGATWKNRTDGQTTSSPITITELSSSNTSLSNGTSYNIMVRALNALGEGEPSVQVGPFVPFGKPIVTTGSATGVTSTSMTFGATVNANGSTTTNVKFQYGTSSTLATFNEVNATNMSITGAINTAVSASLTGQPTSAYYYRIVATNEAGVTSGEIQAIPYSVSGGSTSTTGSYTVHTFTGNGTLSITGVGSKNIEYLVIAGGGGGGRNGGCVGQHGGGGGGAGGYRSGTLSSVSAQNVSVTVGAGGATRTNGSNSTFGNITSIGGGRGASILYGDNAASGGSGGGGVFFYSTGGGGTAGQGNSGATSADEYYVGGSGGGGAGSAGSSSSGGAYGRNGGNGGSGLSSSITGSSVVRAAGGGGGAGYDYDGVIGSAGASSTSPGSGGAGASYTSYGTFNTGGTGRAGIVIVRYLT